MIIFKGCGCKISNSFDKLQHIDAIKSSEIFCNFGAMNSAPEIVEIVASRFRESLPEECSGPLMLCLSGGADSMAMLRCALLLKLDIIAVNCNFHLRGEESDRDSEFVARECSRLGVRLFRRDFCTRAYMAEHRVSEEMACRELRYAEFRRLRKETGACRIVTAHNSDDNIETFLLNLMRGAGIKGLGGMATDNGEILRPLLQVSRREIEQFMDALGAEYVTDSSNLCDTYRRNFLRLKVIPLLESRWPEARQSIAASMSNLREARAIYDGAIASAAPRPDRVSLEALSASPSPLTLLHERFRCHGASDSQLREMLACRRAGAKWMLPAGEVVFSGREFRLFRYDSADDEPPGIVMEELPMSESLCEEARRLTTHDKAYLSGSAADFCIRALRKGDRLEPLGMNGSKLVSRILHDAKVAAHLRGKILVVAEKSTGRIVWIPGIRRSRLRLLSPDTVAVTLCRLEKGGMPSK